METDKFPSLEFFPLPVESGWGLDEEDSKFVVYIAVISDITNYLYKQIPNFIHCYMLNRHSTWF